MGLKSGRDPFLVLLVSKHQTLFKDKLGLHTSVAIAHLAVRHAVF